MNPGPDMSDQERLDATWSHMVAAHMVNHAILGEDEKCEALYQFEAIHSREKNLTAALAALAASLVDAYAEATNMPAGKVVAGLIERAETQHDATNEIIRITKGDNQ